MTTKNALTIRLNEPVVYLQTASGRSIESIDSQPSMVRGLLTLHLTKPTRISHIEIMLLGETTNSWLEGVGLYQIEMGRSDTIYSASTVFFSAASAHAARRTTSVGPGVSHDEVAHEEREGDEHASPPRPVRRFSVGNSTFQHHHISHRPHLHLSSPWTDPVTTRGSFTTTISPTSDAHVEPEVADLDTTNLAQDQSSSSFESPYPSTSQLPSVSHSLPYSYSPQVSAGGDEGTIHDESTTSSPSISPTHLPTHLHQIHSHVPTKSTSLPPTDKARADHHDRHSLHFSLSGISNAILGKRESSVQATPSVESRDTHHPDDDARGRTARKEKDQATSPGHRSRLGKFAFRGQEGDDAKTSGDGWMEFKKGTYNYPISFPIPADSPPSLQGDFGTVKWHLKAEVHRPGMFTPKLTAEREVTVIECPGEDDIGEDRRITVEGQWQQRLEYVIVIQGGSFYVGGIIPIQIKLLPLAEVKIHRVAVILEERIGFFVSMQRIGCGPIRRIELLSLKSAKDDGRAILPLESGGLEAFKNSPLYAMCAPGDDPTEMASSLMGPGPWTLSNDLKLPSCASMHFTCKSKSSHIIISHVLKFILHVEGGDDSPEPSDRKHRDRMLYEIVVEVGVKIFSCRCNPKWISLPGYSESFNDTHTMSQTCPCVATQVHANTNQLSSPGQTQTQSPLPSSFSKYEYIPPNNNSSNMHEHDNTTFESPMTEPGAISTTHTHVPSQEVDALLHQNELFERLVSGQESEVGEAPPAYEGSSIPAMDV